MAASKTFRAITEVHITEEPGKRGDKAKGVRPVKPKVKIIAAGSKFKIDPDADETKSLLAASAIEAVKDDEDKNPVEVKPKKTAAAKKATKAPAKDADKNDGKGTDDNENLV